MPKLRKEGNVTGKKYGKLLVLDQYTIINKQGKYRKRCLCLCDCQLEFDESDRITKEVDYYDLINGKILSCGCHSRESASKRFSKDLTGMTFSRLTVLKRIPPSETKYKWARYICQCSCEDKTIIEVNGGALPSGNTKSCGCLDREVAAERMSKDHSGKRFGKLLALEKISARGQVTRYRCLCDCGCERIASGSHLVMGDIVECYDCAKKSLIEALSGEKSNLWKGGYWTKNIPAYDTYVDKLEPIEECKRNDDDPNILEVKCTFCESFFVPTRTQVEARIKAINDSTGRENHFYCLDKDCKNQCSIFGRHKFPRGFKPDSNRPYIDPYWREQVLANADYKCEICGSEDGLEAHHIQSATLNPMLANDVDNGICCCSQCHYDIIHSQPGCRPIDLQCNSPE